MPIPAAIPCKIPYKRSFTLRRKCKKIMRSFKEKGLLKAGLLFTVAVVVVGLFAGAATAATTTPVNNGDPFQNGDFVWSGSANAYKLNVSLKTQVTDNKGYIETNPFSYPSFLTKLGDQYGWGNTKLIYSTKQTSNTRGLLYTTLPTWGDCAQKGNSGVTEAHYSCWRTTRLLLLTSESGYRAGQSGSLHSERKTGDTMYHGVFVMLVDNDHGCTFTEGGNYDQASLGGAYVYADWQLEGDIKLTKTSSNPSLTNNDPRYSLAGAVYGIFDNKDCSGSRIARLETNGQGVATATQLPVGTYYIKEQKAPTGFDLSPAITKVEVTAGATSQVQVSNVPSAGTISLAKSSSMPSLTQSDSRYSLAGAEYGIFSNSSCTISTGKTLLTSAAGNATSAALPAGIYYVKETKAPQGFALDVRVYTAAVGGGVTTNVSSTDTPLPGYLDLQKHSSNPNVSDGNPNYDLEGALYGVFNDSNCSGDPIAQLTTDESGYAKSSELPAGFYWVRELSAPRGYLIEEGTGARTYSVAVGGETTARVGTSQVIDTPAVATPELLIAKIDAETGVGSPLGSAHLAGAQFSIDYYTELFDSTEDALASGDPVRSWIVQTDENGHVRLEDRVKISGDDLYYQNGRAVLPMGTVLIQETKAPEGYLLNPKKYLIPITASEATAVADCFNTPSIPNQVKRGDIALVKYKADNLKRLSHVPFRITCLDTNESHILVTDENGEANSASSWVAHSALTNENDKAILPNGIIDESSLNPEAGIWFDGISLGANTEANDKIGALPYGRYRLQELPVSANQNMEMITLDFSITKDGYTFSADLPNHLAQNPFLETSASDADSGTKDSFISERTTIVDHVAYGNLQPEKAYRLHARLMDASTGEAFCDRDGNSVEAERVFHPAAASGEERISFTFDSRTHKNTTLVVFEELLDIDGDPICSHAEWDDYDQTIYLRTPQITTQAKDTSDEDSIVAAEPNVSITDTVIYSDLKPGEHYTIHGRLLQLTSEGAVELLDEHGAPLHSEVEFIPDSTCGEISVNFSQNAHGLAGEKVVVFEQLMLGDVIVATHEDPHDTAQTVAFESPAVRTFASSMNGESKSITAQPEVQLIDAVELSGLTTGATYELQASLHHVSEGAIEDVLDENDEPILFTQEIIADASTMRTSVRFELNTQDRTNHDLVVFETLSKDGITLVDHNDPLNGAQTVSVVAPEIETQAKDAADGDHVVAATQARIVDTVTYSGLTPGHSYTLCGSLYTNTPGEEQTNLTDNEGKAVTATVDFIPEQAEGSIDVRFDVDLSQRAETSIVVYEELYSSGVLIASHIDPNSAEQTVRVVPLQLASHATDASDADKIVRAQPNAQITDILSYQGAAPSAQYLARGLIIDTETELPLLSYKANNGVGGEGGSHDKNAGDDLEAFWLEFGRIVGLFRNNTAAASLPHAYDSQELTELLNRYPHISERLVTSEHTFIAFESEGSISLDYAFDGRTLQNTGVVCVCWMQDANGFVVATHCDPTDRAQMVDLRLSGDETKIETPENESTYPKTGVQETLWKSIISLSAITAAIAVGHRMLKRYRTKRFNRRRWQ